MNGYHRLFQPELSDVVDNVRALRDERFGSKLWSVLSIDAAHIMMPNMTDKDCSKILEACHLLGWNTGCYKPEQKSLCVEASAWNMAIWLSWWCQAEKTFGHVLGMCYLQWRGNLVPVDGNIDSHKYVNILETKFVTGSIQILHREEVDIPRWQCTRASVSIHPKMERKNTITNITWPPQSTVMNFIENMDDHQTAHTEGSITH